MRFQHHDADDMIHFPADALHSAIFAIAMASHADAACREEISPAALDELRFLTMTLPANGTSRHASIGPLMPAPRAPLNELFSAFLLLPFCPEHGLCAAP